MQISRRNAGTGAWLIAASTLILILASCAAYRPAASSPSRGTALPQGALVWSYQGPSSAFAAAWSPNGRSLAIGEADGMVEVHNAVTGTTTVHLSGHTQPVWAVAWSPDGQRLASGSWDTTVQVWRAKTGQHLYTYRGHQDIVGSLVWSPDGKHIASVADDVQVWQAS